MFVGFVTNIRYGLDFSSFSFITIISINDDHEHYLAYHDHHHHGDW